MSVFVSNNIAKSSIEKEHDLFQLTVMIFLLDIEATIFLNIASVYYS